MTQVTLSDKYQVVIPKELRKGLKLKPGQKVTVSRGKSGNIVIDVSPIDQFRGIFAGKKIWGEDPTATIRKMRDDWDD
jgi:AbrB family looped-hinge helix DNA binding protein